MQLLRCATRLCDGRNDTACPTPRLPCPHPVERPPALAPTPHPASYTEAIEIKPDKSGLHLLLGNRSLAYARAQRWADALADADAALGLAPRWAKGHWRRGAALLGLRRAPEATLAFRDAWEAGGRDPECEARLRATVQRLTREQLGSALLALLAVAGERGQLERPRLEAVSEQEMREASFRLVAAAHAGQPRPGRYYQRCGREGEGWGAAVLPLRTHACCPLLPAISCRSLKPGFAVMNLVFSTQVPGLAQRWTPARGGVRAALCNLPHGQVLPAGGG